MSHLHKTQDYTVEVFIVCENKVLLPKHDKYNIWLGVGGHIELDENPNQAAIREVKEEVGLDIEILDNRKYVYNDFKESKDLIPPHFLNIHNITKEHKHIALVYMAKTNTFETKEENEKSNGLVWLSEGELKAMSELQSDIKTYALAALKAFKK